MSARPIALLVLLTAAVGCQRRDVTINEREASAPASAAAGSSEDARDADRTDSSADLDETDRSGRTGIAATSGADADLADPSRPLHPAHNKHVDSPAGHDGEAVGGSGAAGLTAEREAPAPVAGDGRVARPAGPVSVKYLNENAAQFASGAVRVQGELEGTFDQRSFVLESGGPFDDEIRVVVPKGVQAPQLERDASLVVTGEVRRIDVAEIEREIGWDLNPEIEIELKGRNVLVARKIERQ